MKLAKLSLVLSLLLPIATGVAAQEGYPSRPLRLLHGFAPGGNADAVSRIVADGLSKELGVSVIVDNKPGAGGNIAAELVARANPDGYTILNATDPRFNPQIFAAAFEARTTYLDMAMTLSEPHAEEPYAKPGVKLGDAQFAEDERWRDGWAGRSSTWTGGSNGTRDGRSRRSSRRKAKRRSAQWSRWRW